MMNFSFGFMPMMPYVGMGMFPSYYNNQINYGLWNMNPYKLMGNFGGTYQFSNYPSYYSLQDVMACQNAANPFFYSNYFLNTLMSMMNPYPGMQAQMQTAQAAQIGASMGTEAGLTIGINSASSSISSLKYQIDRALAKTDLTDEQRAQLEECKRQAEALEARLQQLVEDKNSRTKTIEDIQQELRSISASCTEISRLKDELLRESTNSNGNNDSNGANGANGNNGANGANGNDGANGNNGANGNDGANNVDGAEMAGALGATVASGSPDIVEAAKELIRKHSPKPVSFSDVSSVEWDNDIVGAGIDDPKIAKIADDLYKLIDGSCTGGSNGDIEEFINNNINKNNVVEVMLYWNKNYASEYKKSDKYGMTESIFDEFAAFGKDAVRPIVTALQERLKKYQGINPTLYSEASSQLAKAEKEVEPSRFYEVWKICDEDEASKAINKAHRAIVELILEKEEAENN